MKTRKFAILIWIAAIIVAKRVGYATGMVYWIGFIIVWAMILFGSVLFAYHKENKEITEKEGVNYE